MPDFVVDVCYLAFPAKPSDQAIFDRADRRVHSLFLAATAFYPIHFKFD
jgi:hypothetical protein